MPLAIAASASPSRRVQGPRWSGGRCLCCACAPLLHVRLRGGRAHSAAAASDVRVIVKLHLALVHVRGPARHDAAAEEPHHVPRAHAAAPGSRPRPHHDPRAASRRALPGPPRRGPPGLAVGHALHLGRASVHPGHARPPRRPPAPQQPSGGPGSPQRRCQQRLACGPPVLRTVARWLPPRPRRGLSPGPLRPVLRRRAERLVHCARVDPVVERAPRLPARPQPPARGRSLLRVRQSLVLPGRGCSRLAAAALGSPLVGRAVLVRGPDLPRRARAQSEGPSLRSGPDRKPPRDRLAGSRARSRSPSGATSAAPFFGFRCGCGRRSSSCCYRCRRRGRRQTRRWRRLGSRSVPGGGCLRGCLASMRGPGRGPHPAGGVQRSPVVLGRLALRLGQRLQGRRVLVLVVLSLSRVAGRYRAGRGRSRGSRGGGTRALSSSPRRGRACRCAVG